MPGEWTDQIARVEQMQAEFQERADWWNENGVPRAESGNQKRADALAALLGAVKRQAAPSPDPVGASPEEIEQLQIDGTQRVCHGDVPVAGHFLLPPQQRKRINAALRGYAALLRQQQATVKPLADSTSWTQCGECYAMWTHREAHAPRCSKAEKGQP
jgi:hypothetical protein